jgi:hypothetical protein
MNVTWKKVSAERYDEMLGILPPEIMLGYGFLVGEPYDYRTCAVTGQGAQTFSAFVMQGDYEGFFEANQPLTKNEFKALDAASIKEAA